jgi:intracellular septation protein
MENQPQNKNAFFLASFLPAVGYWILDAYFSLTVALIGGIILAVLEILFEKYKMGHVHTLSKFNFFLIVFLGGLSFVGEDGIWFKLQPAISLFAVGGFMGFKLRTGNGLMFDLMESMPLFYGIIMLVTALWTSTSLWIFFKTAGMYIGMVIFGIVEFILNRNEMRREYLEQIAAQQKTME